MLSFFSSHVVCVCVCAFEPQGPEKGSLQGNSAPQKQQMQDRSGERIADGKY